MHGLSERTLLIVQRMFGALQQEYVADVLLLECGNNLPLLENQDQRGLERVRFAVLKLSNGDLDAFLQAIRDAQCDWRDILVAAGFADDVAAHDRWANDYLDQQTT
jgi:hypothetical protein